MNDRIKIPKELDPGARIDRCADGHWFVLGLHDEPNRQCPLCKIDSLQSRLDEETAIVNRIWDQFGSPDYDDLKGRSIYDLIDEGIQATLKLVRANDAYDDAFAEVKRLEAKLDAIQTEARKALHSAFDSNNIRALQSALRRIEDKTFVVERNVPIEPDLSKCPACGGPADNGHDRCLPPNPYYCSKCMGDSSAASDRLSAEWRCKGCGGTAITCGCNPGSRV